MARPDRRVDVLVVGAGIAGTSAAMFLAESGVSVAVVERGRIAGEASGLNAGMIDAPGWGAVPDLETTLKMGSLELFRHMQVDRGVDIGFRQCGQLVLLREDDWDWAVARVVAGQQAGLAAELVDRRAVRSLEPAVDAAVTGAVHSPGAGRAEPVAATAAFADAAVRAGAEVLVGTEVTGAEASPAGFVVTAGSDRIGAEAILVAAGPWCNAVGRLLGVDVPIVPVRGQMWATEPLPPTLFHAIAAAESTRAWERDPGDDPPQVTHRDGTRVARHLYGRQRANGEVIFGGDRVPGAHRAPDPDGIAANHAHAAELLPFLGTHPPVRTWAGLMPFTRDGRPLIGAVAERPGLYVVGGLASSGFNRGPMAGRLVAELIAAGTRPAVLDAADPAGRVRDLR